MPSPPKLKLSARSRIGELISMTPLPSAARGSPFKSWHNPEGGVCSARSKELRSAKNTYQVKFGGTNTKLPFRMCVKGSSKLSIPVATYRGDWKGSGWTERSLTAVLLSHYLVILAVSVALGGTRKRKVAKAFACMCVSIPFSVPFMQKTPLLQLPSPPKKLVTQIHLSFNKHPTFLCIIYLIL